MNQYVFGGTNIKLGLFELPNVKLVKLTDFPTPNETSRHSNFWCYCLNMQKVCEELGTTFDHVKGIGLAIPCPVIGGCVDICAKCWTKWFKHWRINEITITETYESRSR